MYPTSVCTSAPISEWIANVLIVIFLDAENDSLDDILLDTTDTPYEVASLEASEAPNPSACHSARQSPTRTIASLGDDSAPSPVTVNTAAVEVGLGAAELAILQVHLLEHFKSVPGRWYGMSRIIRS